MCLFGCFSFSFFFFFYRLCLTEQKKIFACVCTYRIIQFLLDHEKKNTAYATASLRNVYPVPAAATDTHHHRHTKDTSHHRHSARDIFHQYEYASYHTRAPEQSGDKKDMAIIYCNVLYPTLSLAGNFGLYDKEHFCQVMRFFPSRGWSTREEPRYLILPLTLIYIYI